MRKSVAYFLGAMLVWGCASAPTQEMSDARQALRAAQEVVDAAAPSVSQEAVERAGELLEAAELELRQGEYKAARMHANEAKALAIEARERAAGGTGS